jgi:hypothetical protein
MRTVGIDAGQKSRSNGGHKRSSATKRAYLVLLNWLATELGPGPWKPRDLFAACEAREQKIAMYSTKEFLQALDRIFLFTFPLFDDKPGNWANSHYPLQFTIARPEDAKGSNAAWRYTELLRHLKNLDETELRWLLIARWLYDAGVCEPEEFLPKEVFLRMLKRIAKKRMQISPSDLSLWQLVKVWWPYFENLLNDLHRLPKTRRWPGNSLLKIGYREDAIALAIGKRSTVQVTTSWLALRNGLEATKGMNARTLENAYSRVDVAFKNSESAFQKFQAQQSDSKSL